MGKNDEDDRPDLAGVILRVVASDRGGRGPSRLAEPGAYARAARLCLAARRPLVISGFFVAAAGVAETDGPPGAAALVRALLRTGAEARLCGDVRCEPVTRACAEALGVGDRYVPSEGFDPWDWGADLLVFVERLGRSVDGSYRDMRLEDVSATTASLDDWALEAPLRGVPVIGIGDGGNEVGMGGIREGLLRVVPDLAPGLCVVPAEECLACDVSNWGAYALVRMMESAACREDLLPSPEEEGRMLAAMARVGAVDGTTKRPGLSVDGFPAEVLEGVLLGLRAARGGMKFPLPGPLVPS